MWHNHLKQYLTTVVILLSTSILMAQSSNIQVISDPGLSVFLDVLYKGKTNSDMGGIIIENVSPGSHTIKVVKEGFNPQEEKITVKPGEIFVYKVKPFIPKTQSVSKDQSPKADNSIKPETKPTSKASKDVDGTSGTFKDPRDGEVYKTIVIGKQTWMAENLRASLYNDGTPIPILSDKVWNKIYFKPPSTPIPGHCWYNNDDESFKNYGTMYNFYVVETAKICPVGWHVPLDADWNILISFLGGERIAGGKLKEAGTVHWQSPNEGASNETGFTAFGPFRDNEGFKMGGYCYYWTDCFNKDGAYARYMRSEFPGFSNKFYEKTKGFLVRCIKNN